MFFRCPLASAINKRISRKKPQHQVLFLLFTFASLREGAFFFNLLALYSIAARTRVLRARSLILSPSKKSIARLALPSRPALKSLSGSDRLAPSGKGSFTFPLWGSG